MKNFVASDSSETSRHFKSMDCRLILFFLIIAIGVWPDMHKYILAKPTAYIAKEAT